MLTINNSLFSYFFSDSLTPSIVTTLKSYINLYFLGSVIFYGSFYFYFSFFGSSNFYGSSKCFGKGGGGGYPNFL